MNRPEREKPPFLRRLQQIEKRSPAQKIGSKNPEGLPRDPRVFNDNTVRGILIPGENLISDKRSEEK